MSSDDDYMVEEGDFDPTGSVKKPTKAAGGVKKKAAIHRESKSKAITKNNSNPRSQARDYSFKQRFIANYGHNEDFYQRCIRYKSYWEDKMFYPAESVLNQTEGSDIRQRYQQLKAASTNIPDVKIRSLLEELFAEKFWFKGHSEVSLKLQQGPVEMATKLRFGEYLKMGDSISRNGLFLNAGGHVTSLKWLPRLYNREEEEKDGNEDVDYLAATVVRSRYGESSLINHPQLAFLDKSTSKLDGISHGIQIWKYENASNHFSLHKFYLLDNLGVCSDISWAPIKSLKSTLGYLCGTFAGKLHLFKIPTNKTASPELATILEPSMTYSIEDPKDSTLGLTCYNFLGYNSVIVGLLNGSIAEFLLPVEGQNKEDWSIPSFIFSVTEAIITSVTAGEREPGKYTLIVNSAGSRCFALEYNDFQHGRVDSWATNSFVQPTYNDNLKIFITDDAADTIQYSYIKHPSDKATMAMKVDGTISALHLLQVLQHPIILNGTSTGEISVLNVARKILHGGKATNKTSVPLKLWKFSKVDENTLVANGDMEPGSVEKSTRQCINPPDVLISAIAWSESLETSSVYAAAIASGVVLVERLDPKGGE